MNFTGYCFPQTVAQNIVFDLWSYLQDLVLLTFVDLPSQTTMSQSVLNNMLIRLGTGLFVQFRTWQEKTNKQQRKKKSRLLDEFNERIHLICHKRFYKPTPFRNLTCIFSHRSDRGGGGSIFPVSLSIVAPRLRRWQEAVSRVRPTGAHKILVKLIVRSNKYHM